MRKYRRDSMMKRIHDAAESTSDDCVMVGPGTYRPSVRIGGTLVLASRAVWIVAHGDPGDSMVLHSCHRGEAGCINIRHLYLGDQTQNMLDMARAGRGNGRLSPEQVLEVRQMYADGVGQLALARHFGVGQVTISRIVNGQRYAHVDKMDRDFSLVGTIWKLRAGRSKYIRIVAELDESVTAVACRQGGESWTEPATPLYLRRTKAGGIFRYERVASVPEARESNEGIAP